MKLQAHYEDIKTEILRGLERKQVSLSRLAIYFKEVQYNKVNGDFNRACTWLGFQLNGFWRDIYREIKQTEGINDDHIKTLYRKFFKELQFNIEVKS